MDAEHSDTTERVIRLLAKGYARALLAKARERDFRSSTRSQGVIPGAPSCSPAGERMSEPQTASIAGAKQRIALEFVRRNIPIGEWFHDVHTGTWTLSYGKDERAVYTVCEQEMADIAGGYADRFRELSSRIDAIAATLHGAIGTGGAIR